MSDLHGDARVHTLQGIFDWVPDGAFVCDYEGRVVAASATLSSLLGHTKENLVGRAFGEHVSPSHQGRWRSLVAELANAPFARADLTLVCADESALPVAILARAPPEASPQSRLLPFFFVRDTRDRRDIEIELARARAELEVLTRTEGEVPDVIATLPQTGLEMALKTIAFQAQVRTDAGVVAVVLAEQPAHWIFVGSTQSADMIGETDEVHHLVRGVIDEARIAPNRQVRCGDERVHLLIVPLLLKGHAEGAMVFADKQSGRPFDDDDERIAKMTAARAAAALASARVYHDEAHEHAWLQTIFDQMPEGITVFDANGEVVQRNPMACSTGDLCTPDGRALPPDESPAARALRTGQTIASMELAQRNQNGELVPVLVSAAPIQSNHHDDSKRQGVIMLCREIVEIKQVERMREEWATIICHDLRQPVGVVSLTAEALERQLQGRLEQRQLDALRRIGACAARLDRMIGDLADASLIEAKHLQIDVRPTELRALVERAAVNAFDITGHRVEVRPGDAAWAVADPDRVEQVLSNLVSNAIKYGDPSAPILITVERGAQEHVVSVTNRGNGIAAEEIPALFDRFSRGKQRSPSAKGFGLGLYIARGLIEAQHGRLWVGSDDGLTTFSFALPRAREDAPSIAQPHHDGPRP